MSKPQDEAYVSGYHARIANASRLDNPYDVGSPLFDLWDLGFTVAMRSWVL